ncbi:hypothetical protein GJ496_001229 [Pomphorhynchus laevis]|nr:hypothetical protein GJ496_001229 [Pomphorhynchus laevis]
MFKDQCYHVRIHTYPKQKTHPKSKRPERNYHRENDWGNALSALPFLLMHLNYEDDAFHIDKFYSDSPHNFIYQMPVSSLNSSHSFRKHRRRASDKISFSHFSFLDDRTVFNPFGMDSRMPKSKKHLKRHFHHSRNWRNRHEYIIEIVDG